MAPKTIKAKEIFLLAGKRSGETVIPAPTPLTRLNFFDGKFLRGEDLQMEQRYLRELSALSNQAGGAGVVHGFNCTLGGGDRLDIGAGLAIDPKGRVLLLPQGISLDIEELIEASRRSEAASTESLKDRPGSAEFEECELKAADEPGEAVQGSDLYLIALSHAEAHCGEEDVFGKLCEQACVTGTDRPYIVEGLLVRAIPLNLATPLKTSGAVSLTSTHLRSLVAGAYFRDERKGLLGVVPDGFPSLISGEGLSSQAWCLGAQPIGGSVLAIAVLGRAGRVTTLLDAWISRRERMESPPRHYWAWRMAMRPWNVFLAQVLQFQCHLRDVLRNGDGEDPFDPCQEPRELLLEASRAMSELRTFYSRVSERLSRLAEREADVTGLRGGAASVEALEARMIELGKAPLPNRVLIQGGIVELPPAGYLPVVPSPDLTVNRQVRRLLGEGLDLRFCVVRSDFVAHALEEARHMERICLLQGLDDPDNKPRVDILVPDGEIARRREELEGVGFRWRLSEAETRDDGSSVQGERFLGIGRVQAEKGGPFALHAAGSSDFEFPDVVGGRTIAEFDLGQARFTESPAGSNSFDESETREFAAAGGGSFATAVNVRRRMVWATVRSQIDPFELALNQSAFPHFEAAFFLPPKFNRVVLSGRFTARSVSFQGATRIVKGKFEGTGREFGQAARVEMGTKAFDADVTLSRTPGQRTRDEIVLRFRGSGGSSSLSGRIIDSSGNQLPGTTVRLVYLANGTTCSVVTDNSGEYRFENLAPGNYELAAEGLQRKVEPFTIEEGTDNELELVPTDEGAFEVDLTSRPASVAATEFVFLLDWTARPVKVRGEARRGKASWLALAMSQDDEALQAGGLSHTQALRILELLAQAADDPQLADEAARLLFPPPKPAEDAIEVRAVRDWVLFHRRRRKDCGQAEAPRPARPPRRFQAFHARLENQNVAAEVIDALRQGALPDSVDFEPFSLVEYAAGLPALASSPEAVIDDWKGQPVGDSIHYDAIAGLGAAAVEEPHLEEARLARLRQVLSQATPLGDAHTSERLKKLPRQLRVSGSDGSIVVLTLDDREEVEETCHSVVRAGNPGEFRTIRALITNGDSLDNFPDALLGEGFFEAGTDRELRNSLQPSVDKWQATSPPLPPVQAAVFFESGTPGADVEAFAAQARHIVARLGGGTLDIERVPAPEGLPFDCPALTLLGIETQG